jgi:hypothetical protein
VWHGDLPSASLVKLDFLFFSLKANSVPKRNPASNIPKEQKLAQLGTPLIQKITYD